MPEDERKPPNSSGWRKSSWKIWHGVAHPWPPCHPLPDRDRPDRGPCGGPAGQKTTKYEHVIPQLVAVQEDPAVEGLLVLINTVGGDVEAGLALAELIASISKPSARSCWAGATLSVSRWQSAPGAALSCPRRP